MAMASIVLVNVWRGTPFFGITLLSGLQTIPVELYEAAEVDGANRVKQFVHITLPSLAPVTLLVTLVSTIWTLNDFQHVWLLTRGGPSNATQIFSTLSYTMGFLNMHLGEAIAVSAFTLPIMLVLVVLISRNILNRE
jgi:multiple sugar transport system permease protein